MAKKSLTTHFKGFSVVQGDIKVNISLARFEKQFREAQFWLDSQVMTDMVPLMPHGPTGDFIQRTRGESAALAGTGLVVAAVAPMGRFLYEGKGMVDEETGSPWAREGKKKVLVSQYGGKTNAKEDLTYSNRSAVPHWFDKAKQEHITQWVDGVKRIAGEGEHG